MTRPLDVLCPKWEPASPGSKACRYYLKPEMAHGSAPGADYTLPLEKEGPSPAGLCALPSEMLCVEWVRRNGTYAQQQTISLPAINVARAPDPLSRGETRIVSTPFGQTTVRMPEVFKPAKGIDSMGLEALEQAGVEVELSAPYLDGGRLALVSERTGRLDRAEITFREAATVRLIVDAFPGAHVVGYKSAPRTDVPHTNGVSARDRAERASFTDYPLTGAQCSVCKEPQRMTPGGISCPNGHGGAPSLDDVSGQDPLS